MGPEARIERSVCSWAKKRGITPLKLAGMHARGQADRMFMKDGVAVFVEMKAPGNKPTALQAKWLADRRADGFEATWHDNGEECKEWLTEKLLGGGGFSLDE